MRSRCPETVDGAHGEPNSRGFCPYCGTKIGAGRVKPPPDLEYRKEVARRQDPAHWLEPDESAYYDE